MSKMGWFGVVKGHPRSLAMSPFDGVHMISYSSLIETMHLSCTFLRYGSYLTKFANFHFSGVADTFKITYIEFLQDSAYQKLFKSVYF